MYENVYTMYIDGQAEKRIPINSCGEEGVFTFTQYTISYPPFYRKVNVKYYNYEKDLDVFVNPFDIHIKTGVDFTKSDVQCPKCEFIKAGEKYDLYVYLYDVNGICFDGNYTTNIPLGVKVYSESSSIEPRYFSFEKVIDNDTDASCRNKYYWNYTDPIIKTGKYKVNVFGKNGNENITIREYTQEVETGDIDPNHIFVKRSKKNPATGNDIEVALDEKLGYNITAQDKYNNSITTSFESLFELKLRNKEGTDIEDKYKLETRFEDSVYIALLSYELLETIKVYFRFGTETNKTDMTSIIINDQQFSNDKGVYDSIKYLPGNCSEKYHDVDYSNVIKNSSRKVNVPTNFTIKCHDMYNNIVNRGGQKFLIEIFGTEYEPPTPPKNETNDTMVQPNMRRLDSSDLFEVNYTFTDNDDGTYTVKFTPIIEGKYIITIKISETVQYNRSEFVILNTPLCPPADAPNKTMQCPNQEKCVEPQDAKSCLTADELCENNKTHPFNCKLKEGLTTDKCVTSFKECSCPSDHTECDWYQLKCVPSDRTFECPFKLAAICKNKKPYTTLCDDGICRLREDLKPNQYVCPYGYYQCSDLTCRSSPDKCIKYEECDESSIKCDDQSCQPSNDKCPSRVTCNDPNYVVCPNGKCVENELQCTPIECYDPTPYLCTSGVCAKDAGNCPSSIVCGHTYSLCEDNICRNDCRETTY